MSKTEKYLKSVGFWFIIRLVYGNILRGLLIKAIDDPDEQWDDWTLDICDRIFEYEHTQSRN